ncbi:sterol homeostasis protein, partial [Chytridiales sp. JEL 0842]
MPVCVECGSKVSSLYTEYSKGNIRLTKCASCGKFADKYIENDSVIVFIDMLLHKRPVYNKISMALVLSSFGKLLLIAMVIWDYNELEYSWLVNLLVLTSNLEALS